MMLRTPAVLLFVASSMSLAIAQQVVLDTGEELAGKVLGVAANRARIQLDDGRLLQVPPRSIDHVRVDGERKYYAASLVEAAIGPVAQELLQRLQKGEEPELPDLLRATGDCPRALLDELGRVVREGKPKARRAAVTALAIAATPESMRLALDLTKNDATLFRALVTCATQGACLGAIVACDGLADVERGFDSKDRLTRVSCAMIAVELGSKQALPVLETFVKDADHHIRDSVAMTLAEHGNAAGAALLMTIGGREHSPEEAANRCADEDTRRMIAVAVLRERVHAVELLGTLQHTPATPMLRKLSGHHDAKLAAAARAALAAIEAAAASQPPAADKSGD